MDFSITGTPIQTADFKWTSIFNFAKFKNYLTKIPPLPDGTEVLEEGRITNKEIYLDSVLEREKLASTAVGFGVGIPHGKSEVVKTATVVFGRSDKGIKWNEDGETVKLLFLLAIPIEAASNQHLKILAALSRKLMDEDFIGLLKTGKNKADILNALTTSLVSVTS